jgi:hypothetical protein
MSIDRLVGLGATALGILLFVLAGESDAYLFPRLIALAVAMLGLGILGSTFLGGRTAHSSASAAAHGWTKLVPVLAILVAYRWAMEFVGFYTAAFAAFVVIVWLYAPEPTTARTAAKRVAISAAFVGVIFAIFSLLLRVQTPRGFLI